MSERLENRCVWKDVAERDETETEYKTFSPDKKCLKCDGYDTKCKEYYILKGDK